MPRVTTKTHGVLTQSGTVRIPPSMATKAHLRLHPDALVAFGGLYCAAFAAGFELEITSGWRRHRWKNRGHYNATLVKKYGARVPTYEGAPSLEYFQAICRRYPSSAYPWTKLTGAPRDRLKAIIRYGRRWLAYNSPHETGRAFDLKCHGLAPVSRTAKKQKQTDLYAWLKEHAATYGWHPYLPEPWHWEFPG